MIDERTYRAMPGLSGTEVAKILDNPADLKWQRDHPTPSTAAQSLGTLVHALVLTPHERPPFVCNPYSYTTERKAWTERKAECEALGFATVPVEVWDRAHAMADAVLDDERAFDLLEAPGDAEATVIGEHRGAPLKGRIDMLPDVGPVIDLKTARDVSPAGMSRFIGEYGTATQLAHYALLAGREDLRPIIIAVRNQGRPAVAVYRLGEMTWLTALSVTSRAWDIYAECVATDTWPDTYAEGIGDLDLKPWALDALEGDVEIAL